MNQYFVRTFVLLMVTAASASAAACGGRSQSTPTSSTEGASSAAAGTAGPLLVEIAYDSAEKTPPFTSPPTFRLSLVGLDGRVAVTAEGRRRSLAQPANYFRLPWFSVSRSRLYYLDGDAQLKFVSADGSRGLIGELPVGPQAEAAFAVSPDDAKIAVAVIDYATDRDRLYVEDLDGSHHVDLYDRPFDPGACLECPPTPGPTPIPFGIEYPVTWHDGRVLMGSRAPLAQNLSPLYARFSATSNRVDSSIDPATGERLYFQCSNMATGPLGPAGFVCTHAAEASFVQQLDGSTRSLAPLPENPRTGALSPSGDQIAWGDSGNVIRVERLAGGDTATSAAGFVVGWIDDSHLVVGGAIDRSTRSCSTRRRTPPRQSRRASTSPRYRVASNRRRTARLFSGAPHRSALKRRVPQGHERNARDLASSEPVEGTERVLVPVEREFEVRPDREANGVPLHPKLVARPDRFADELGVERLPR